jgi:hypothetical protein
LTIALFWSGRTSASTSVDAKPPGDCLCRDAIVAGQHDDMDARFGERLSARRA